MFVKGQSGRNAATQLIKPAIDSADGRRQRIATVGPVFAYRRILASNG